MNTSEQPSRLASDAITHMDAIQAYGSEEEDEGEELSGGVAPAGKRARLEAARHAGKVFETSPSPAALPSLLPPAAALLDGSYSPPPAAAQRALEQAVLHQGRARTFPHVTGSYATHVYIEAPAPPSCQAALEQLLRLLQVHLPKLHPTAHASSSSGNGSSASQPLPLPRAASTGAPAPAAAAAAGSAAAALAQQCYHISLSRTVALQLHQIEPLVDELRQRLRRQDTFCIRLGQLVVFCNDDRTRTFLSLAAEEGSSSASGGGSSTAGLAAAAECPSSGSHGSSSSGSEDSGVGGCNQRQRPHYCERLVGLCHTVSGAFAARGLQRFYADPQPHASVAWLLGDCQQQLEAALAAPKVQAAARALAAQQWRLQPAAITCKAGQREHVVWPVST